MYQGRHYPWWGGEPLWEGKEIRADGKLKGFALLHPMIEGDESRPEWHGNILATVMLINPLGLKHPDNTNSGVNAPIASKTEGMTMADVEESLEKMIEEGVNVELMAEFIRAISDIGDLLSVATLHTDDFWVCGFSVPGIYREGETGEQCWNRMSVENGVLGTLVEAVREGDIASGLKNHITNSGTPLPEPLDELPSVEYMFEMSQNLNNLFNSLGYNFQKEADVICRYGVSHRCRRGKSGRLILRGQFSPREAFLPDIEMSAIPRGGSSVVSKRAAENFKRLVNAYRGDGYALEPTVTEEGEIMLTWKNGPSKFGCAILKSNGRMELEMGRFQFDRKVKSFSESHDRRDFDEHALSYFIERGELPD